MGAIELETEQLSDLYRNRFAESELARKNDIWKVLCADYFQQFIQPSDTVVDLACGYGEFINNIQAGQRIAVDLNTDAMKFLGSDITFHHKNVLEFGSVLAEPADVVFTSNFLEHLPDKSTLDTLLEQIHSALKPGGKYLIMGPNLRYVPGKYWDFYDHHLGLTHLSLEEALKLKGFEIETCIDRFLPFTTQGALPTHPLLVKLYLKVPLAWRLLGEQFFIIARKPS
ncbi:MAG: SAM-dependent methyltransferase [Halioglobus sp.]